MSDIYGTRGNLTLTFALSVIGVPALEFRLNVKRSAAAVWNVRRRMDVGQVFSMVLC